MTYKYAVLRCQPSLLPKVKEMGYIWHYSNKFGNEEIDVIVDNIHYEVIDGIYQDPDEQLCDYYDIDYNQVNCIEGTN